jgi:hypothetical protein
MSGPTNRDLAGRAEIAREVGIEIDIRIHGLGIGVRCARRLALSRPAAEGRPAMSGLKAVSIRSVLAPKRRAHAVRSSS